MVSFNKNLIMQFVKKFGKHQLKKLLLMTKNMYLYCNTKENSLEQPIEEFQEMDTMRDNEVSTLIDSKRKLLKIQVSRSELLEKSNDDLKAQLEDDLETAILSVNQYKGQVETLKTQVSTLSDEIIKYKSLGITTRISKEILEATVKSKEELLKTQVSRNELLEKSNIDLKAQLEALKALNVAKDEKVKLQEELKISREMLKEAQKAQEQAKENGDYSRRQEHSTS